jgi:hypothetical protein
MQPVQPGTPSMLSLSRALLSDAKREKVTYWWLEVAAAVFSVGVSLAPWAKIAAALAVLAVALKISAKLRLSASRRAFRQGERARRYDFYGRTLGWPVPPLDRADLGLTQFPSDIQERARALATSEVDYYAHSGPPSAKRLVCNLAESMFWTERLMGAMAKARWVQVAMATSALVIVLVGTIVVQPGGSLDVLRFLGSAVTLLVAIDVLGEAQSFGRGEREVGRLLSAVTTVIGQGEPSRDESMRLLTEYNCLLADLPLLPDRVYEAKKTTLNAAWTEFQAGLPGGCGESKG